VHFTPFDILLSHQIVRALFWLWSYFTFLFLCLLLPSFNISIWITIILLLSMIENTFNLIWLFRPTLRSLLLNTLLNYFIKIIGSHLIIILLLIKNTV